jgi:hypothetical protein
VIAPVNDTNICLSAPILDMLKVAIDYGLTEPCRIADVGHLGQSSSVRIKASDCLTPRVVIDGGDLHIRRSPFAATSSSSSVIGTGHWPQQSIEMSST